MNGLIGGFLFTNEERIELAGAALEVSAKVCSPWLDFLSCNPKLRVAL